MASSDASLAGLLVPLLAAWLASLVAAWLAACLADCLLGCLVGCLVARSISRLLGWLSDTGNTGVAGMVAGSPTASPRATVGQRRSGREGACLSDMAFVGVVGMNHQGRDYRSHGLE